MCAIILALLLTVLQATPSVPKPGDASQSTRVREFSTVSVNRDWADWGLWGFNGLLVIVGALQLYLLFGTLRAIQRQAEIMEEQAKAAKANASAAEANAIAAKEGAEATKQSIEMLIKKERPRIRIEPGKLTIHPPGDPLSIHETNYKVFCYGTTPAFIEDAYATVSITNSEEPPDARAVPMSLTPVLNQNPEGIEKSALVFQDLDPNVFEGVNERKLFAHFYGLIKYKDVFDRGHETKFRYLWRVTNLLSSRGGPYAFWMKHGPDTDNSET
jgi:hypothetical protein